VTACDITLNPNLKLKENKNKNKRKNKNKIESIIYNSNIPDHLYYHFIAKLLNVLPDVLLD